MKAKLIKDRLFLKKIADNYTLHRIKDGILTIEGDTHYTIKGIHPFYKLSLKNCQAIERGYDLDELAREITNKEHLLATQYSKGFEKGIIIGFQKALELMSDKKFSVVDIDPFIIEDSKDRTIDNESYELGFKRAMKLFQPDEIDVEVEMICPHPSDTYRCGIQYGCDEDGCNHPNQIPYLDADGCLILKRI